MSLAGRPDPTIVFHSDARPDFSPFEEDLGTRPAVTSAKGEPTTRVTTAAA
jgi:hypothetical protein